MGAEADYAASAGVILGCPLDLTVSYRPGSRFGPAAIRSASKILETYSPALDRDLEEIALADLGDLDLPPGNLSRSLELMEEAAATVFRDGKFLLALGGEHLVSLPLVRAAHARYPGLALLHFDAHYDLRSDYAGERLSHATVLRRIAEEMGGENIWHFGIRSGTRDEVAFAREHTHPFLPVAAVAAVAGKLGSRPVYLSLDIDVVDPAFAPGTGTPEPGGATAGEILAVVQSLAAIRPPLRVVGLDLVEVSPASDPSERTAVLAAKIVREGLLAFGEGS